MFAYAASEAGASGFALATGRFLGLFGSHEDPAMTPP